MNDKRRQILYGLLALVVIIFGVDTGLRKFYDEPTAEREARLSSLRQSISDQRKLLASLKQSPKDLEILQQRSLPNDLELARSSYQNWLLELIQATKLQQPKVDASDPVARRKGRRLLFHALTFTVRGRGEMSQIIDLLRHFYTAGHLHKIRSLSITPLAGSESLDFSLAIEALVLPGADRSDKLSSTVVERLAFDTHEDYQLLARRNLFAIGGAGTPGHRLLLSAITSDVRGIQSAWITNTTDGSTQRYGAGERIQLGLFDAEVVRVDNDRLVLRVDGRVVELGVGNHLADAKPGPSAVIAIDGANPSAPQTPTR